MRPYMAQSDMRPFNKEEQRVVEAALKPHHLVTFSFKTNRGSFRQLVELPEYAQDAIWAALKNGHAAPIDYVHVFSSTWKGSAPHYFVVAENSVNMGGKLWYGRTENLRTPLSENILRRAELATQKPWSLRNQVKKNGFWQNFYTLWFLGGGVLFLNDYWFRTGVVWEGILGGGFLALALWSIWHDTVTAKKKHEDLMRSARSAFNQLTRQKSVRS